MEKVPVCRFSACAMSCDMGNPKRLEEGVLPLASHSGVVGIASQMGPLFVWKKVLSPRMFLGTPTEADVGSVDGWPPFFFYCLFFFAVKCCYLLLIDRYLMIISAAECGVSSVPAPRGQKEGGKCHVLKLKWPLQLHTLVVAE